MTQSFTTQPESEIAHPRLTPEEYARKKQAEREGVYMLVEVAASEIVQSPENFRQFLNIQSRMDRYSTANALLIYKQFPRATQLKEFSDWAAENVRVSKGEKSVLILEPSEYVKRDGSQGLGFQVKKVFDILQTNSRRPAQCLAVSPKELADAMLQASPVSVQMVDGFPDPDRAVFYSESNQALFLKRNVDSDIAFCQNLARELGRASLAQLAAGENRQEQDFQAECVGYMFCRKYGSDTRCFAVGQIPEDWKQLDARGLRGKLSEIRSAFTELHSRTFESLYRNRQERQLAQERQGGHEER